MRCPWQPLDDKAGCQGVIADPLWCCACVHVPLLPSLQLHLACEQRIGVIIMGPSGSGKSTLLKVLAGLYPPDSGNLVVDGTPVARLDTQSYRELFAAIFADFHLFERLYGLLGTDEAVIGELLKDMQLSDKVRVVNDRWSTLELSTGQRKRLALVVSLLDQKPLLVFDELAADQDPEFRQFLYEELLPRLRSQGTTVIAATHDDRYFHVADKVIKMEYGKATYVRP